MLPRWRSPSCLSWPSGCSATPGTGWPRPPPPSPTGGDATGLPCRTRKRWRRRREEVPHGGAGLLDRRAWLRGNVLSTSYEFADGAVRFEHQGDARRYAERFGLAAPVMSPPAAPTP